MKEAAKSGRRAETPPVSIGDMERQRERLFMSEQILFLQRQLESERKLNLALMKQLEEKDRQIAMVLERHYEQHVIRPLTPAPAPQVAIDPESLDEVARFDPKKDAEHLAKEQEAFESASRALDRELDEAFGNASTPQAENVAVENLAVPTGGLD